MCDVPVILDLTGEEEQGEEEDDDEEMELDEEDAMLSILGEEEVEGGFLGLSGEGEAVKLALNTSIDTDEEEAVNAEEVTVEEDVAVKLALSTRVDNREGDGEHVEDQASSTSMSLNDAEEEDGVKEGHVESREQAVEGGEDWLSQVGATGDLEELLLAEDGGSEGLKRSADHLFAGEANGSAANHQKRRKKSEGKAVKAQKC